MMPEARNSLASGILTDDDILDFELDTPIMDDAINQVSVKWLNTDTNQEQTTSPVSNLGAIMAYGINAQTNNYTEIFDEDLALRCAQRDCSNGSTPLLRPMLTTNRKPYALRMGQYLRIQAPKRRIADMVCMVGDIDKGTLKSGAITLTAIQDISMVPRTTYIASNPVVSPTQPQPEAVTLQAAFEAPYYLLAESLDDDTLAALPTDAGFLQVVGGQPNGATNYELWTALSGDDYEKQDDLQDWCPTATVIEADDTRVVTEFTLADGSLLSQVRIGSAALWGSEIVRVDALDATATPPTMTAARGCADTVATKHVAGERIWFFDDWAASDGTQYAAGQTADAKLLPRAGGVTLSIDDATALDFIFAGRASKPYPPAQVKIAASDWPANVAGEFSMS
jgi:hypothetical protein